VLAGKDELLIVSIGGLEQIGANCTMIGNNKQWIIVDLGIAFYDKCGIEILTPDISFPIKMKDSIKGIFITHAHEDHIGAMPYLWENLRCPIYLTEFPFNVLKQKFKDHDVQDDSNINIVVPNKRMSIGNFEIEYIPIAHSILGACSIYIKTKAGSVFHTGDWKIDKDPLIGDKIDEKKMISVGEEGVDCLLCDSTNILSNDKVGTELSVRETLSKLVSKHPDQRITITCFASNLARIETILNIAKASNRKVAIIGRSMHRMLDAVCETRYLTESFRIGLSNVVDEEEAVDMPKNKVLFICTGSQGELRSALYRIARKENKTIKLGKDDLVVFSSKIIPGNELSIRDLQNLLVKSGVELITTDTEENIHVSGHPDKPALEQIYKWLKPQIIMPIHGDPMMIIEHAKFAKSHGIKEAVVAESGEVWSLKDKKLKKVDNVGYGMMAVDGRDIVPLTDPVLKDRMHMSYSGHVSVSFVVRSDTLSGTPDIAIDGIYVAGSIQKKLESLIYQTVDNCVSIHGDDIINMKGDLRYSIKKLFSNMFSKKPVIAIHIHKI
jgi:ribonuclease J